MPANRIAIMAALCAVLAMILAGCGAVGTVTSTSTAPAPPISARVPSGLSGACGHGIEVNAHVSCPFAQVVAKSFSTFAASGASTSSFSAYSPTTRQSYDLRCRVIENGSMAQCTTGNAVIVLPTTEPAKPKGGEDEIGSASHATDQTFCMIHACVGNFTEARGTIVECADHTFSHSGTISGACSDHGGEAEGEQGETSEEQETEAQRAAKEAALDRIRERWYEAVSRCQAEVSRLYPEHSKNGGEEEDYNTGVEHCAAEGREREKQEEEGQ